MKIRKGDTVKIITGKDRNKSGKVLKVFPKDNKITVEGLNLVKKHQKPRQQGAKGEIIQVPRPLHISNAVLICPHCLKTTRINYKILEIGKTRICKECGSEI